MGLEPPNKGAELLSSFQRLSSVGGLFKLLFITVSKTYNIIIICQYGRMILRDAKELADIQDTKSSYNELLKIQRINYRSSTYNYSTQKISTVI